jgi:8-oxo-dGTP diphosphatase
VVTFITRKQDDMGAKDQGADATAGRWLTIPRTLCFVTHGDDILLLKRAAHKRVYPGRYNGLGGHLERDEDPLTGAMREVLEETGLAVKSAEFCGVIHVDAGEDTGILVFVFKAEAASRQFADSDEGTLEWVPRARIGELPVVEDLPAMLARIFDDPRPLPFFAHSSYDSNDEQILAFAHPNDRDLIAK